MRDFWERLPKNNKHKTYTNEKAKKKLRHDLCGLPTKVKSRLGGIVNFKIQIECALVNDFRRELGNGERRDKIELV